MIKKIMLLLIVFFLTLGLSAQSSINTSGGDSLGAEGAITYSVGQFVNTSNENTVGVYIEGVLQPYEIFIITGIIGTEAIDVRFEIYPNPTDGLLTLDMDNFNTDGLRYILYDQKGVVRLKSDITSNKTRISMETFKPSIFILKVLKDNEEIKVFKIIYN